MQNTIPDYKPSKFEKLTDKLSLIFLQSPIRFMFLSFLFVYAIYNNLISFFYQYDEDFKKPKNMNYDKKSYEYVTT